MDNEQCTKCVHWKPINGAGRRAKHVCHYALDTRRKRPATVNGECLGRTLDSSAAIRYAFDVPGEQTGL